MIRDAVLSKTFADVDCAYGERDCLLYALAVGLGADPCDERELPFVYEGRGPAVLPTMASVIGMPSFWLADPALAVDWPKALHGEEAIELHRPLPPSGPLRAATRVVDVVDKGAGRGAFILIERTLQDAETGAAVATVRSVIVARGDGGSSEGAGGSLAPLAAPKIATERAPDTVVDLPTRPASALLYRLCGDLNPLHADPAVAAAAGFDRPILHGLCTFAVAGHAVLAACCVHRPERLKAFAVRFVAPVFPGETIRTRIWREGEDVAFRSEVVERGVLVLDRGTARLAGPL